MKVRNRVFFYISILLYRITLDAVYVMVLSADPVFGDYYNTFYGITSGMILSYLLLLLYAIPITDISKYKMPSTYVIITLFLMTYVPWNSIWGCRNIDTIYTLMINIYWIFIIVFYYIIVTKKYKLLSIDLSKSKSFLYRNKWIIIVFPFLILGIIVVFSYYYFGNGINLTFSFSDANDLRMTAREYEGGKWMLRRLLPWAATIIFPIAFLIYAEKKKYIIATLFGLGVLISYSIVGMKQWIFILAIVVIAYFFVRFFKGKILYYLIPSGFVTMNAIVILAYKTLGNTSVANYTVRRVMYEPCLIGMHHIDYFLGKPKLLFTQCLLGWLAKFGVELPYSNDIGYTIGEMYYSADTNATAGSIADAFENLGVLGLIVFPLVIVITVKLFDVVAVGIKEELYVSILFVYVYSIMSGPLTIAILSYGFLFALVYLWAIKASQNKDYFDQQFYYSRGK